MLLLSHYVSSEEYILRYDDISILENIDNSVSFWYIGPIWKSLSLKILWNPEIRILPYIHINFQTNFRVKHPK